MIKFSSHREKRLWLWAALILMAIYSTLFFGGRIANFMIEKRLIEQSTFYLFLLLVSVFFISGLRSVNRKVEYWLYAGIIAVIGMALLRMDLTVAERSHLFEYGLLAIVIKEALIERKTNGLKIKSPAVYAMLISGTIGLLDEIIQVFLPYRVFDPIDIGFNYFASAFGVLISTSVNWIQRKLIPIIKK